MSAATLVQVKYICSFVEQYEKLYEHFLGSTLVWFTITEHFSFWILEPFLGSTKKTSLAFWAYFGAASKTGKIVARDRFLLYCLQLIAKLQSYASQETPRSLAIGWDWGAKPTDSFNATITKIDEI